MHTNCIPYSVHTNCIPIAYHTHSIPTNRNLENLAAADPQLYRTIVDQIKGNNTENFTTLRAASANFGISPPPQLRRWTFPLHSLGILTSRECSTVFWATAHCTAAYTVKEILSFPQLFQWRHFYPSVESTIYITWIYEFYTIPRILKTKKEVLVWHIWQEIVTTCRCWIKRTSFLVANITDSGRETPNYERSSETNGKISTLLAKTVQEAKITKN